MRSSLSRHVLLACCVAAAAWAAAARPAAEPKPKRADLNPIPNLAAWERGITRWLTDTGNPNLPGANATLAAVPAPDALNVAVHLNHDGLHAALRGLERLPGNAALLEYAAHNRRLYRDGYLVPIRGAVAGYYNFPEGLSLDWRTNRDAASREALFLLRRHAPYVNTSSVVAGSDPPRHDSESEEVSREVAYALQTHVEADRCGYAEWDEARVAALAGWALGQVGQWTDPAEPWRAESPTPNNVPFTQPFMMGITAHALADYLDHLEGDRGGTDARVVPALEALAEWLWQNAWLRSRAAEAAHPSYAPDRMPLQWFGDDARTWGLADNANDVLHNMVSPLYAWLYRRTGNAAYRERGDVLFAAGADSTEHYRPKQYNELYRWSHDYVRWRSGAVGGQ